VEAVFGFKSKNLEIRFHWHASLSGTHIAKTMQIQLVMKHFNLKYNKIRMLHQSKGLNR